MTRTRRLLTVGLFLVALPAETAAAHPELTQASPGPDAVFPTPPTEVVLVFNEGVEPAGDALTVTASDGTRVDNGAPVVAPSNTVTVGLSPLPAGQFSVTYRVLAQDGHVVEGTYAFIVTAADTPSTSAAVSAPSTSIGAAPAAGSPDEDGASIGLRLVGVAVLIGLAGGLLAWRLSASGEE